MSDIQLYTQIVSFAEDLKKEVVDFVDFLKTRKSNWVKKKRKK